MKKLLLLLILLLGTHVRMYSMGDVIELGEIGAEAGASAGATIAEGTATTGANVAKDTATVAAAGVTADIIDDVTVSAWRTAYNKIYTFFEDYLTERAASQTASKAANQFLKDLSKGEIKINPEEMRGNIEDYIQSKVTTSLKDKGKTISEAAMKTTIKNAADKSLYMATAPAKFFNNTLIQLMVPTLAFMSWGINAQWISQDDADAFNKLAAQQKQITNDYNNFLSDYNQKQVDKNKDIVAGFLASQQLIVTQRNTITSSLQKQLARLYESISINMPKQVFLIDPITLDQLFEHSVMLTPASSYNWYNVFQYGDWEYNPAKDSFIQNEMVQFYPQSDPSNPEYSQNNSIFCEYVTGEKSYDINVQCTLYQVSFPFFVGIMFNKARWISGDPERLRQCRLFGLYGSSDGNNTISLYLSENVTQGTGANLQMSSPMKQITSSAIQPLLQLPDTTTQDLVKGKSVTFNFNIKTEPTKVSYKIWDNSQRKPGGFKYASQLNPLLFLYGGIGFIASGCRAEFNITNPKKLKFSSQAITKFKQNTLSTVKGSS